MPRAFHPALDRIVRGIRIPAADRDILGVGQDLDRGPDGPDPLFDPLVPGGDQAERHVAAVLTAWGGNRLFPAQGKHLLQLALTVHPGKDLLLDGLEWRVGLSGTRTDYCGAMNIASRKNREMSRFMMSE